MSLQVLVNGFDITNGITHRINWVETSGLFDPAALVDPEVVDTFDGPYRVRQTTTDFGSRDVLISGFLIVAAPDYASKLRALDALQMIYAARPSRVTVGTLELQVDFGRVEVAQDQLKRLNGMIRYTVRGTAIPATFASTCGSGTGYTQGIPVDTSRVNEAATLASMASGVGTITNPGDVPVAAVLTIQNNPAAVRVYYLATSSTGRRVPISTDSLGVGRLDERAGLYLAPGVNRITAYQAATGTATFTDITVMSFFGTAWQFSGNQAAGTATRMDLGPAMTVNRTGSATYSNGALIQTALDDVPRIGWSWINRRNLIVNSVDLRGGWTDFSLSVRTHGGATEPFGYTGNDRAVLTASDATTTSISSNQYTIGALAAISYVASVYILKDNNSSRKTGVAIVTTGGVGSAILNTQTGVIIRGTNSSGTLASITVGVSDAGLWWRVYLTWTGEASNAIYLEPAVTTIAGTGGSATAIGSAVFACPQVEIGTTPTAYQATDASGIALDHPANDGGLVLEGTATNLCLQSEAFNTTWTIPVGSSVTANTVASPDGLTTADTLSSSGLSPTAEQTITVAASTNYTFSCWVRAVSGSVSAIVEWENASTTVNYAQTTATLGTTWTRITATGTTPAGVTSVKVRVREFSTNSIYVWGAQMESGTAATSYIPTTTASVLRSGELAGIVSPHNLLLYSEPISQGTIGSSTTPWQISPWTAASSSVDSPQFVDSSTLVNVNTSGTPGMYQDVTVLSGVSGKTFTFSVWIRQNATTASIAIRIMNQAGAATRGSPVTCTIDGTWRRYSVTATMDAADTSIRVRIDTYNAAGSILVYGAQLTEGYLPGRYVRTTDTQVLPTTVIDPSWSQNGYIEADITWPARTVNGNIYSFGEGILTTPGTIIFTTDQSGTTIRFGRYDSASSLRNASVSAATIFNDRTARVRMEWTNYLLAGSRFMLLRLYLNNTLQVETNYAGTAGSSWPTVDVTRFGRLRATASDQGVVSNLVLGIPALPEGARAAGI
jgi:hypothetical protein